MLKQGLFTARGNDEYALMIIQEPQFYRFDMSRPGVDTMTDFSGTIYSMVKKRKAYQYGNRKAYELYKAFQDKIHTIHAEEEKTSSWENGRYVTKVTKKNTEMNFQAEIVTTNGVLSSESYILGEESLFIFVTDAVYGVKLDPVNFGDYEEVFISKNITGNYTTPYYPLSVLKKRYDISHIDKKDCLVVTDEETARKRLHAWAESSNPVKGFDTETTGTDVDMYGEDHLVGIILAEDVNTSTYYPFRHEEFQNLSMDFLDELMQVVISQQEKLVAHNKKFDRKVMMKEGYDLLIHWDTMLLSFIINPVIEKGAHALKELMLELNGLKFLELVEIFISEKFINFAKLPIDIVKYYACPDGYNVIELFMDLYKKLPVYQRALFELECKLADLKADQEYYGMRVDVKKYERGYANCNYVIDMLLKAFRELTRNSGNINSSAVLSDIMYNQMKCKVLLRTKTGKASTSAAAIKKLANIRRDTPSSFNKDLLDLYGNIVIKGEDLAKSKYPALVILDAYRTYIKRKTAFYARFERTMKTGRIFFWINQNGAASGRQSSPMHQLPPEMKSYMLSDFDDRDFWGPDFSQIELRMIAYLAGETDLIDLCKDPRNDIHRIIGSLISNLPMWQITAKMRSEGKRRNFGVVYLISEYGLAGQMYGPGYTKEQVQYCKGQLDAFYKRFKRITKYIRENGIFVKEKGYMMTKGYNRIRYFKEILDPEISSKRKASLVRQANNMPVQGTAADYLKVAEVNMYYYIREKGWYDKDKGIPLVRPMLSIHDEILISAHESIPEEEIIKMIKLCMEVPVEGAPPFFVAPAKMDNWEGHSDDSLAIPVPYRDTLISDYEKTGKSVFKTSKYEIIVPKEVKDNLQKRSHEKPRTLVKDYLADISWKYISGDYGENISEEGKANSFLDYIESGKTIYKDTNYRKLLADYRENELREYMDGLIREYGSDYKVVSEHVRHPSLTHELLARYKKELDAVKNLELDHEHQIEYATKCYIEGISVEYIDTLLRPENTEEEFFSEIDNLVNFDSEGNVVYEYEEEEEDEDYIEDTEENFIEAMTDGIVHKVWEIADAITIDVDNLDVKDVDKVIARVWNDRREDGFFKVYLLFGGQLVDAGFKVEDIDYDEITELINQLERSENID